MIDEALTTIQAGYAQAVITPSLDGPVYLAGFGRNRRALSVHDELYARALAVMGDSELIIVIAVDVIGLDRTLCRRITDLIQTQLPTAKAIIAATHTHHGPDTLGLWGPDESTSGVDPAYMADLVQIVAKTALSSATNTRPALLAAANVIVSGVAQNFRDPQIVDETLTCLQFRDRDDQRPLATWFIFPCHPEVLGDQNAHITSDYIHFLRLRVEEATGAPCFAHVGALGGMMSPAVTEHTFAAAAEMGATLAAAGLRALQTAVAEPLRHLHYQDIEFSIPLQNPLFEMAAAGGLLPDVKGADGKVSTVAGLLRLGSTWLFAVPGELLPKQGLRYRATLQAAGAQRAGVIGLANDELGYILPVADFKPPQNYLDPGRSYEESMSVGPQTEPLLSAALQRLIEGAHA